MRKSLLLLTTIFLILYFNIRAHGNYYFIILKIDEDMVEASGTQRILYVNPNDYPVEKLYFRISYPNIKAQCQVKKITEIRGIELPFSYSEEYPGVVEIDLRQSLEGKGKISLFFQFNIPLNPKHSYYIFSSLSGYWHPKAIPYYKGKLQPYHNEIASYRVEIEFPNDKTVVTSGEIVSYQKNRRGLNKIISKVRNISNFGLIFFDNIEKNVIMVETVKITIYFSPAEANWTKGLDDIAADVLRFYIKEIGFYPHKVINIIPGAVKSSTGGYPVASNIIAIHSLEGESEDFVRWITAHEIAHYYWGFDYVLFSQEYCNWMGIALGIYTDRLYAETHSINRRIYDDFRYRYLAGALQGYDTTIMQKMENLVQANFDWNNIIMHGKSFTVIEMLEQIVGKKTFFKVYKSILERYKYKVIGVEDFQNICEEISGQNLGWFFQPWLYSNDKLDYIISQVKTTKNADKFITRVAVKKTGQISMPIEVEITTIDGQKHRRLLPRQLFQSWVEFVTSSSLLDVKLDPSYKLPLISRINDEIKKKMIMDYYKHGQFTQSLTLLNEVLAANPNDAVMLYYRGLILRRLGRFEKSLQSFQKLIDIKDEDEKAKNFSSWSHILRGYIFDLQDHRQLALDEYKKALELPDYQGSLEEAKKRIVHPFKIDEK